jgi:hypothetical protein
MPVLGECFQLFQKYSQSLQTPDSLTPNDWRMIRNNTKIMLAQIIIGPSEVLDR